MIQRRRSSNTSAYKIGELRKLASCGAMQLLRGADPVLRWSNGVASLLRKKTSLVGEVFRESILNGSAHWPDRALRTCSRNFVPKR